MFYLPIFFSVSVTYMKVYKNTVLYNLEIVSRIENLLIQHEDENEIEKVSMKDK